MVNVYECNYLFNPGLCAAYIGGLMRYISKGVDRKIIHQVKDSEVGNIKLVCCVETDLVGVHTARHPGR